MISKGPFFMFLLTLFLCQTLSSALKCRSCTLGSTQGTPLPGIFRTVDNKLNLPNVTDTCNETFTSDVPEEECGSPCLQGFFYEDFSQIRTNQGNQENHLWYVFVRTCAERLLEGNVANWDKKFCGEIDGFDLHGQKLYGKLCLCSDGDNCNNDDLDTISNFSKADACAGNRCKEGSNCTILEDKTSYKCSGEPLTTRGPTQSPGPTTSSSSPGPATTTTTKNPNGAATQRLEMFWLGLLALSGVLGARVLLR